MSGDNTSNETSDDHDQFDITVQNLKRAGNKALCEDRHWDAIDNFSLALFYKYDPNILVKRAFVYLEIDK